MGVRLLVAALEPQWVIGLERGDRGEGPLDALACPQPSWGPLHLCARAAPLFSLLSA